MCLARACRLMRHALFAVRYVVDIDTAWAPGRRRAGRAEARAGGSAGCRRASGRRGLADPGGRGHRGGGHHRCARAARSRRDANAALRTCCGGATAPLRAMCAPVLHAESVLVGLRPRVGAPQHCMQAAVAAPCCAVVPLFPLFPLTLPSTRQPVPSARAQAVAMRSAARSWQRCRRATAWRRRAPGAAWRPRLWRRRAACPAARRARPRCRRRPRRAWRACWTARCRCTFNGMARARRARAEHRPRDGSYASKCTIRNTYGWSRTPSLRPAEVQLPCAGQAQPAGTAVQRDVPW